MRWILWGAAPVMAWCLVGCEDDRPQSMLSPAGPVADRIATLWWVMFAVYTAVFVATLGLLGAALAAPRRQTPRLDSSFIVIAGIVIPTLILTVMLIYTVQLTRESDEREPALRVQVIGHRWWWEVRYPDHGIVDANEIHMPAGQLVELELRSADVVHSFWVPRLAGKMDMLPEHATTLRLQAHAPGVFRGQCAEFCGTQHARMALRVVAHEPEAMQAWLDSRRPALPNAQRTHANGLGVFEAAGCAQCHRIAGVSEADAGPDLTHIGSRLTLGAGVFDNSDENLARWIDDPQAMKPGVLMPPTPLSDGERQALVIYLRSLK